MDTVVIDVPEESRYEIRVDGTTAGFAEYRLRGDILAVLHTEVDEAYQGQGLAGRLVRDMLADLRERGLQLHPYCPLVHRLVRKNLSAYLDLVPESARKAFRLPLTAEEPATEDGPPAFDG
ncbi:GNAT family N-acetyltransferase [Brachybacterium paraconglomeratum]|uniref:GNAT family N-acetyltransferase n=1 Tax=Brachybacterium paraconglomeratum TaxID=173362 RepID=UPI0031EE256A